MKPSTVALLGVCGVVALGGGWYFGTRTEPAEQTSIATGGLMFPGLAAKLGSVAKLEVAHQGKTLTIEKRPDGPQGSQWGVASMHDYPVQETKLRGLLTGLTELRLSEPRTSDPSEFARLGVEDPNGKTAASDLLTLIDGTGKPVIAVIIGHRRVRSQGSGAEEVYVRRPDENQAWLAQGSIAADADPALWLNRDIANIAPDRIASVNVNDNALVFGKTDGKFALLQPADHPKLEDYKVGDVSRALETLTLISVKADADVQAQDVGHAVFTTSDGLAITIHVFHAPKTNADKGAAEDKVWARFTASDPDTAKTDAVKKEADTLNQRWSGWSYEIGSWKEKSLVPTVDDLKAEEPKKPAAAPPSAAPSGAASSGAASSGAPADGAKPPMAAGSDPVAK